MQLSKVWAAVPKDDGGKSFYAGDGVNKAHITPSQMYSAFEKLQKGGMNGMSNVLLEPGEKVFMPGQWDASIESLNSSIPRFQTGGVTGMKGGDPNYGFRQTQQQAMTQSIPQPIIINTGGGGGGATASAAQPAPPSLPNNPMSEFASSLIMTRDLLSSKIGG